MFNRVIAPRSNFYICFAAGLLIGINTTRKEENGEAGLMRLTLPFMALYAGLRFPGDFDQKKNRIAGMLLGILVGSFSAHHLRTVLTPPASTLRP